MSVAERLALLDELWDSLAPDQYPMTSAQIEELDRRLDDLERDSELGVPWEDALRQIQARRK
jgi:putative addiction module component (TIGR02574 family)